jgi:hypothetical protein
MEGKRMPLLAQIEQSCCQMARGTHWRLALEVTSLAKGWWERRSNGPMREVDGSRRGTKSYQVMYLSEGGR